MYKHILVDRVPFAGDTRSTIRVGKLATGHRVAGMFLDFFLVWKTGTETTAKFKIDSHNHLHGLIESILNNLRILYGASSNCMVDCSGVNLRKLHIMKTGFEIPGVYTPLPYESADAEAVSEGFQVNARLTVPIDFTQPLSDPLVFCSSSSQLQFSEIQLTWGDGVFADQIPTTWTLQPSSYANVVLQLAPSKNHAPGPELNIREIKTDGSFLTMGPGLVTHVFGTAPAAQAGNSRLYTWETDCQTVYIASHPETLASQYQLETGVSYLGPKPEATTVEGAYFGSIRQLFTPLRWLAKNCAEDGMIPARKGERLSVTSGGLDVVVERVVSGCSDRCDI